MKIKLSGSIKYLNWILTTVLLFVWINANTAFVNTPTATSLRRVGNNNGYVSLHSMDTDDEANCNDANMEQPQKSSNRLFGRRGILKSLIGGTISMAATDLLLNTAITTVSNNPLTAGLYQRILTFGSKYSSVGAVASTDLTAWVASQEAVASTPEIQAWLAAQKKLQTMFIRKSVTTTTSTLAATAAAKRTVRGGILEEGLLAVAALKATLTQSSTDDTSTTSDIEKNDTLAAVESSDMNENNEELDV